MSGEYIRPLDGHKVVVGWDPRLQSYFGHVQQGAEAVLAVGMGDRPLRTVEELREAMGEWGAVIDEPIASVTSQTIRRSSSSIGSAYEHHQSPRGRDRGVRRA